MSTFEPQFSLHTDRYYDVNDVDAILDSIKKKPICYTYKKVDGQMCKLAYYNVPMSFDTEASSWSYTENKKLVKRACMYAWTIGINGYVIFGRTWDDLLYVFKRIALKLRLCQTTRCIIYVHNLSYDFQWIAKRINFTDVFAIEPRKVIYACAGKGEFSGIEMRCSYILSNYSLADVGKNLLKYKVQKMEGDLDYSKVRHHLTPMTETEINYCTHDSYVVMAYIQELIEEYGCLTNLPLTSTGFIRNKCRNNCLYSDNKQDNIRYRILMKSLTLEPDEYKLLKQAFAGGFTHANAYYVGDVVENVISFDFNSSYPACLVCDRFPMSKGKHIERMSKHRFLEFLDRYCCLFNVKLTNVRRKENVFETPISHSKCLHVGDCLVNNGRIVDASEIFLTVTELDFKLIQRCYDFDDSYEVSSFWYYEKGYLPKQLVETILSLYVGKTELKGVEDMLSEYMHSKSLLNACYGMTVTDIVRGLVSFSEEYEHLWEEGKANYDESITKYDDDVRRFLFYPWGVWCTAYARTRLFSGILEAGTDFVYADTDSIKLVNYEAHAEYFKRYAEAIREDAIRALQYHGIDINLATPKTIKGKEKPIGNWDNDGVYIKFKTLGAKRYMVLTEEEGLSLTVSGVDKKLAVPYLLEKCNNDVDKVFEMFSDKLYLPPEYSGKKVHSYIDYETGGNVTDYLGNVTQYHEMSSIHLSNADYELSLGRDFADYLKGVKFI